MENQKRSKTDDQIILELNVSYKVKHEKFEEFPDSYFKALYNRAAQIIKEIVGSGIGDFRGYSGYTEPISNIVTFNGKRGSGKTSAMLSFCDFLRDFEKYKGMSEKAQMELSLWELLQEKVSFTVLDCMDATLIENPSDLLGAILGKMLLAMKEREKMGVPNDSSLSTKKRQLKSQLGMIYSSLVSKERNEDDVSPSEILEQLSRSWNQQEAFREAVNQFQQYISDGSCGEKRNYLVIPIDDVDMNFKIGYQLLEVIRKYLTVPNVIVLLAADYSQLKLLCQKEYKEMFREDYKKLSTLGFDYLEKLIPTGRIVYMPELYQGKMLYGNKVLIKREMTEDLLPIEQVILYQVWEHTGIVLNIHAEKNHWILPHSLRMLSDYINSMRFLIDYGTEDAQRIFWSNIHWFWKDLLSRYLTEQNAEKDETICSIIEKINNSIPQNQIVKLIQELKGAEYVKELEQRGSYGTLLSLLYRIKKAEKAAVLVNVISFAVSLHLRSYLFKIENQKSDEIKKEFLEMTKGDFWGEVDQNSQNQAGQPLRIDFSNKLLPEEINEVQGLSEMDKLILAIQLNAVKTENRTVKGSFWFGNFVNIMFDYDKVSKIAENVNLQKDVAEKFIQQCIKWKSDYETTRVIPFDSVEFMMDLYDRLYGTKGVFSDLRTEISAEIGAEVFGNLYWNAILETEKLLGEYDEYYERAREKYKRAREKYKREDNVLEGLPTELKFTYKEIFAGCPFIEEIKKMHGKTDGVWKIFSEYLWKFLQYGATVKQEPSMEDRDND